MELLHATCDLMSRCSIVVTMESRQSVKPRRPGRPLGFDRDKALHQAMLLFWRHGYESTSISDLTGAMGITPPSLYTAFGDKKQLFRESVQRYVSGSVTSESIIDGAVSAKQAAAHLLETSAVGFTGPDTPRGCLLASATISCSAAAADLQAELANMRRSIQSRLQKKIREDVAAGALPENTEAESLAGHVMAVIQGLSTLARDGASRAKLLAVADVALRAWPTGM